MPPPRRVVVGAAGAVLLCGFDGPGAAGHVPKWSTIYGFDVETNGTGTTGFTNLLWDANLTALGEAVARFPTNKAMWSPVATCVPNKTKVYGEPYCGGATGLWRGPSGVEWQVGADYWVAQVKDKPWVTGMWLGDEPEIAGVSYNDMCELILYLKTALIAEGRNDIFLIYNDGPESAQLTRGMCKGLDYFSIDSYADDPDQEVQASQACYWKLIRGPVPPRKPNPFEPNGQGLWVVPGLFWFMKGCKDKGGAGTAGSFAPVACQSREWCDNGTQCYTSPTWEVGKLQKWWAWAQSEPMIQGFNPWHWRDRPTMPPPVDANARGAVSLGPELLQWLNWIGGNITAAHPFKICEEVLEETCGAQKGGVFACAECAGVHLQALSAAGCDNDAISAWCASAA